MTVMALEGVSRVYGRGSAEVRALDGIDLTVDEGEFVAFMGPSGSGKSTCLNLLGCLDPPSSGTYRLLGRAVDALDAEQRALVRRHWLGFVFQSFNLLPRTTAVENVELPLVYRGLGRAERRARALRALAEVGLAGREDHSANEMSGGEQQRVAVARAIVAEPAVILADEPTGNLDSARSHEIVGLLATLNRERGLTCVMVTHEPDMAAYASRIVRFLDGRIVAEERR